MKYAILAAAAALSLGACTKDIVVGGVTLTPANQQCLATGVAFAFKNVTPDYKAMSVKQKGVFIAVTGEAIADECGVDLSTVKPYLDLGVMVASD